MKNTFKHSKKGFLMVTLFATLLSFANDASFYSIKNDVARTALTLKHVKEGNLLSIKDNNGVILYKESIQKSGIYTKGFDLTSLPDGFYLFELEKDLEIKTIPFSVKSSEVIFEKEKEKSFFKPYTRVKGDLLLVSQLSLNEAPLEINIYFSNDIHSNDLELIHSEKIANTKTIQKIFKLSGFEKGSYKVICSSQGREFVKIID
ncbi:hypothetical protein [uncultured Algibacter sp.]|uniref:hypothetical protein n=1 Tax=uncultured Algibacter sp. TaxID=298659 RepID=UPI0026392DDF|nr:hypothetical protein [uncultured Algibacter sp.]